MTKTLSREDEQFRKLVVSLDGHQRSIGEALGLDQRSVAARLRSEKHGAWWQAFKQRRSKKRRQERSRRAYARKKAQFQEAQRIVAGTPLAEQILLAEILEGITDG